ncbi:MAG: hypothetical protein GY856_10785 [bacterium]|nr:hypothetical protein [bacterium]
MIVAFVTMFLGLMGGVRTVELAVGEPVAQVEILLDGASVGVLTREPWSLEVDFGTELAPHRLVAVARDGAGQELGRAEQWLNLPRPPAEVEILLASDDGGPPQAAQLIWHSASHSTPEQVALSFDGQPLTVEDPQRIALPRYSPQEMHFLRAVVRFSPTVEAVAEAAFGGVFGSTVSTEIQAVAVAVDKGVRLPPAAELSGWLMKRGEPLAVRVVEDGPADVVMIIDPAAHQALRDLMRSNLIRRPSPRSRRPSIPGQRRSRGRFPLPSTGGRSRSTVGYRVSIPAGIDDGDRLRLVTPAADPGPQPRDPYLLFSVSQPYTVNDGSLFEIMARASGPAEAAASQRLADAVAVAGIQAFAGNRRRLVVLVVGHRPVDRSRWSLPAVRRYLSRLEVPLAVWSLGDLARKIDERHETHRRPAAPTLDAAALGEVVDISSITGLRAAMKGLRRELKAQRILWVDGHHLPQQVEIGVAASGIRLAGVSP